MRHITNSGEQRFVAAKPEWVLEKQLSIERGEKTWRHRCQNAGLIVITASQMGLCRLGHEHFGGATGCSWCGRLP